MNLVLVVYIAFSIQEMKPLVTPCEHLEVDEKGSEGETIPAQNDK